MMKYLISVAILGTFLLTSYLIVNIDKLVKVEITKTELEIQYLEKEIHQFDEVVEIDFDEEEVDYE